MHAAHAAPPVPHKALAVPGSQVTPLQHPVGHRTASQAAAHCWFSQCCVPLHAVHAAPLAPQSASDVPNSQVVPSQQPLGHRLASHAATHCWFSQ